jgi:DNA polymerase III epsilon subunit-like protein
MNPASRYDWYVLKNLLSYTKAELAKQPKFDAHYDKLKSLLEDSETVVCGYSIVNDLKYLNSECKRYSLPPLTFSFLDVQTLADRYFESKNQIGIERAYAMLEINDEILLHRSDEDALAAMKVAKKLCEKTGLTLPELSAKYTCTGKNFRYTFENHSAPHKITAGE